MTSTTTLPPQSSSNDQMHPLTDNGASLIARAEALDAFMKMQPAANQARHNNPPPPTPRAHSTSTPQSPSPAELSPSSSSCFCFGAAKQTAHHQRHQNQLNKQGRVVRPRREYYPDNLSVQPERHAWTEKMEWLILACVDFLERNGLGERNIFAVSAVEDLVREMTVDLGCTLPPATDPHVAAGVIKAQIRHADQPLVSKECLKKYIDSTGTGHAMHAGLGFADSCLATTIRGMEALFGERRAFILARIMRLLGRVSANEEVSKMNAHCLAKCVAPSMLHWDPNSSFALLMLGKITAFVMRMIEDARIFDEQLCQRIDELRKAF